MPRGNTRRALQRDTLKNTTGKSKWNSKNAQVTYWKAGKRK